VKEFPREFAMIRVPVLILTLAAVVFLGLGVPTLVEAQVGSTIRARVTDPNGEPIPDVDVEFQYQGETRVPITKNAKTDDDGYFIRVGLKSGPWKIVFTKEGYKPRVTNTAVSGDARSDWEEPIVMAPAPQQSQTATNAAEVQAMEAAQEEAKKLGEKYSKALEAMSAGSYDEAEALFKEVVDDNPGVAPAHHNLGYIYMLKNDGPAAEEEFQKAIAAQPSAPDSYVALSTLMTADGRPQEAYDLLQGAALLLPEDGNYQFALGVAATNLGKDEEAMVAFEKAATMEPPNIEAHYYLATLAVGRNDTAAAVEHLETYVGSAAEGSPNVATATALLEALKK
jgi:Tfp pilus assembly protein PilF